MFQKGNKIRKGLKPANAFRKGQIPWNKKEIDEKSLAEEYKKGKSVYKLAKEFNLSRPCITKRLKKIGIKIRGGYDALVKWNKETPKEEKKTWKGGITSLNVLIRQRDEYKRWVKEILERDNYTCQISKIKGGELEVHHIGKTFSAIKKEAMANLKFNKVTNENKEQIIEEFFKLNFLVEGITLNKKIHKKVHSGEIYIKGDIKRRNRKEYNKKRIKSFMEKYRGSSGTITALGAA